MACDSATCGSSSCGSQEACCAPQKKPTGSQLVFCVKCKEGVVARVVANQSEPMCLGCLHASLLSKFKTAINNHSLVTPSDNVLLAFSGGPASRVALEFLREIRSKAQSDKDASRDHRSGLTVFGLGVVFVNEATVLQVSSADAQLVEDKISSIVCTGSPRLETLHIARLEDVFKNELSQRLRALLESVQDMTGREDLIEYLRMQVLQQVAKEHGYTKLVLGLCTTRIAARVLAATAKGQGYSLPADIQYLDSRWPVPVVLPLRDCVTRELVLHCHVANLDTVFIRNLSTMADRSSSINNLAHTFVTSLQEENASREYTIARTAAKLMPFSFNYSECPSTYLANRRRKDLLATNITPMNNKEMSSSSGSEVLCPVCSSPLDMLDYCNSDTDRVSLEENGRHIDEEDLEYCGGSDRGIHSFTHQSIAFQTVFCASCRFQILPDVHTKGIQTYELLPGSMRERAQKQFKDKYSWMRHQIEDLLIEEDGAESQT
ncbi:unnamed protein product [Sphagnum jensenii]|uniref:Cytoplasmic tRNA 2-thiolation protein 2 n=1 Tax=Sphagnum jensenii TaxID=128206 RepID=A0ABP0XJ17_9BRYO